MKFLGWDCAHKSLAHSYIEIDLTFSELRRILDGYSGGDTVDPDAALKFLRDARAAVHGAFTFHTCNVVDLMPGKKLAEIKEIDRVKLLKKYLDGLPGINSKEIPHDTVVIIETQAGKFGNAGANRASNGVAQQLAMYYADCNINFIDPKMKNKVSITDDLTLDAVHLKRIAGQAEKQSGTKRKLKIIGGKPDYDTRKLHSTLNFVEFVKRIGQEGVYSHVPKEFYDDLADSFVQILAFIKHNKYLAGL